MADDDVLPGDDYEITELHPGHALPNICPACGADTRKTEPPRWLLPGFAFLLMMLLAACVIKLITLILGVPL
jgi:hypothetical protein